MTLVTAEHIQYFKEIDYTPACAAVVRVFLRFPNLPTIPTRYFAGFEVQVSEALQKGYVTRVENGDLALTIQSTKILKTILFLSNQGGF